MILTRKLLALSQACLLLSASLLILPHQAQALAVAVPPPPVSTATATPTVNISPPLGPAQSTGISGAPVTLTATVGSPSGADLRVQWSVDGVLAQMSQISGSSAQKGTTTSLTQTFPPGSYTVVVIVCDGVSPPVRSTPIPVVVLPPVSTSGAKVTGGGSIALSESKGTFGFVAKTSKSGAPQGNFVFQDHLTGRTVKSLEITGLIVIGSHAQFWGTAMINDDGEYNFVVDVDDFAEPGAGVDTFALRLSDGYQAGGTVTSGGNIQLHP